MQQIFESAVINWKKNKGIGSIIFPSSLSTIPIIVDILERIYINSPNTHTIIIVDSFNNRKDIVDQLITNNENANEFRKLLDIKLLKILTFNYLTISHCTDVTDLCIVYNSSLLDSYTNRIISASKFKLICINHLMSSEETNAVYKIARPVIDINDNDIKALSMSSPVKEIQMSVSVSDEVNNKLKQYVEYISRSINIFGSFDNIELARNGDPRLNISGETIRNQIANENGWSNTLDMNVAFNRDIDAMFNPNALYERSITIFNIIRERGLLLTDCEDKLEAILDICSKNQDKKILIISKRSDFASKITSYINSNLVNTNKFTINADNLFNNKEDNSITFPICANFHSSLENIPAIDDFGKPILVKSGATKGNQKMLGAISQMKRNQALFNDGRISILSANNSIDKSLNVAIDILIITSPYCSSIKELKYRCGSGLSFKSSPNIIYKVYVKDWEDKQLSKDDSINREIVKECESSIDFNDLGVS